MRRLFWLAMGVTIGALVVRKLSRAAAAEREAELRSGTGLDAPLPTGDAIQLPGRRGAHSA